jgi:hypothetical protein
MTLKSRAIKLYKDLADHDHKGWKIELIEQALKNEQRLKPGTIKLIEKMVKIRQKKGENITVDQWINDAIRVKIRKEPTY